MRLRGVCFPRCAFEVIFARNQVFMSTLHVLRCVLVYLLARLTIHWPFLPGLQTEKGRGVLTFRRALFIIATGRDESAGASNSDRMLEVGQVFCVSPPQILGVIFDWKKLY